MPNKPVAFRGLTATSVVIDGEGADVGQLGVGAVIENVGYCDHFKLGDAWMWKESGQRKFIPLSGAEVVEERRFSQLVRNRRRELIDQRDTVVGRRRRLIPTAGKPVSDRCSFQPGPRPLAGVGTGCFPTRYERSWTNCGPSTRPCRRQGRSAPTCSIGTAGRIKNPRKAWADACEAAGYPGKLLHDLRRSAIRNMERAGLSRSVAMQLTGQDCCSGRRGYRRRPHAPREWPICAVSRLPSQQPDLDS
jgi:hypothetical protein